MYEIAGKRVFVAGHRGMVGGAIVRRLAAENCIILTAGRDMLDLTDRSAVARWFADNRPDLVFVAAARVGGILANSTRPVDFLLDNLLIETSIFDAAHHAGVEKLVFLGSSCIYPKLAPQPIPEEALLTGPLEPTNEWYAVAKIAGIKLGQAYRRQHGDDMISLMPTNLYGPGDNYDLQSSHVLPALIRKIHEAKESGATEVVMWGTGTPLREFMHVDDCADACVFAARRYSADEHLNIGSGEEISIASLTELVAEVVGYTGAIVADPSRPDGTPRKLMDSSRLRALGWQPRIGLRDGIGDAYRTFVLEGRDRTC